MKLFERLIARAAANRRRIVLPEGLEPRNLQAADRILAEDLADIILLGNPSEVEAKARELGLENISAATVIDNKAPEAVEKYAPLFYELRKKKGITIEDARRITAAPRCIPGDKDKSGNRHCFRRVPDAPSRGFSLWRERHNGFCRLRRGA